jgi:hypothetical protein
MLPTLTRRYPRPKHNNSNLFTWKFWPNRVIEAGKRSRRECRGWRISGVARGKRRGKFMGKRNHDLIAWLSLVILLLVMLVFILLTKDQAGFFQNFAVVF